jgi:hypothetical protein
MDVKEKLDQLTPETERLPNWDAVLRDARPSRARWAAPRLAIVGAVVALAALLAVAPWKSTERGGVLERALAAVEDGSVVHAVVREGWGGDVIDLETGASRRLHGSREVWYDPARGLHEISHFGGAFQGEQLYPPERVPPFDEKTLGLLADGYPEALESGRARLLGPGTAQGLPVYWIRVHTEWLPDVADGKLHEWARDVGVSRETYEPVATRETRDGEIAPDGASRFLEIEMLPAGEGDFTKSRRNTLDGARFREKADDIALAGASKALGRTALWLGESHAGLDLVQVLAKSTAIGREQPAGGVRWSKEYRGLQLIYAQKPDRPLPRGVFGIPGIAGPHVAIRQSMEVHDALFRGAGNFVPAEGSIVVFGGRIGNLRQDGVFVAIEASSEKILLSAARALRPLSAGSGAGE